MEWLIVAFVVVLVFGGIFYVLPSRRERAIGKIRMAARQHSIFVSALALPNLNAASYERVSAGGADHKPTILSYVYERRFEYRLTHGPAWRLSASTQSTAPFSGWLVVESMLEGVEFLDTGYWETIRRLATSSPQKCRQIEVNPSYVRWVGTEKIDVDNPMEFLSDMHVWLTELEESCQTVHRAKKTVDENPL